MNKHLIHDAPTTFLGQIARKSGTDLRDAFINEILETGGTYMDPPSGDTASHLFEVSLHNVVGRGRSAAEAFSDWQQAAQRLTSEALESA